MSATPFGFSAEDREELLADVREILGDDDGTAGLDRTLRELGLPTNDQTSDTDRPEPALQKGMEDMDNTDRALSLFGICKTAEDELAGQAATRAIHALAPEMEQRMRAGRPLSRPPTDEMVRREVRKSDKGALFAYLESAPVLSEMPLREAIAKIDGGLLALLLRRMGVPGTVTTAPAPPSYQARLSKGATEDYQAFRQRALDALREE